MNKKKKKGYISIEAIFGMTALLMIVLLIVGLFTYMYPRQTLEKHVHILAQEAKVTGGLTTEQIDDFQSTLTDMGFVSSLNVYTIQGGAEKNLLGVAPKGTPYATCTSGVYKNFARRDSGQKIVISVSVKAKDSLVNSVLRFFGGSFLPENYVFTETVLSERNRC